jgi:hypothetical protein
MGLHSFRNALLTTVLECAYKNGLSSLGTPDEVDSVLISLVFKLAHVCRFHAEILQQIQHSVNN